MQWNKSASDKKNRTYLYNSVSRSTHRLGIALLLHAHIRLLANQIVPRQIVTNHPDPVHLALLVRPLRTPRPTFLQHVIPRSAAPQHARIDGLLDPHPGGIARRFLVGHVETDHGVGTVGIQSGGTFGGTVLDEVLVGRAAPEFAEGGGAVVEEGAGGVSPARFARGTFLC